MRVLVLKFLGAGSWMGNSRDKVVDMNGYLPRSEVPKIEVPMGTLSQRHIANVLRKLMSERPVPSLRASIIPKDERFNDIARGAYVKITSTPQYKKEFKEVTEDGVTRKVPIWSETNRYVTEMQTVRKAVDNSWPTATHPITLRGKTEIMKGRIWTWEVFRLWLLKDKDIYEEFLNLVKEILKVDPFSNSFEHTIELLSWFREGTTYSHKGMNDFVEKCNERHKNPLYRLLRGDPFESSKAYVVPAESDDLRLRLTIPKGIQSIARIDGYIYIPLPEEYIEKVRNGPGTATLLEGGVVFIHSLEDFSESLVFGTQRPVE